ncbi:hypothetical protein M758_2G081600 [Ceratodon purpureus]|nr:hypothetical protein M758_2G081600 [Ceratodon purpureus]KAG0625796.1 hypothetical protein M758_2G081600 [Ceratodon purpureus]
MDMDMDEDSDPDAGEGLDFSTEEDVDSDFREGFNFTTDEDVDSDIGEEFGSDTDEYVWSLDGLWKYAEENILEDLSNAHEREKSNSDETKGREEVELTVARIKARRLRLYSRLMTELRRFHEPGAETAPDYIKRGVSGLWRGDVILIEDANGNVLGLSQPDVEANHCVFYGQNSSAGVSAGGCPWYEFKIRHEVRKGMLAGKNMIFWYDQDMKCMKKWPRHRWCRILNAEVEIMEAGLLNPEKEWGPVIGRGGHGRVVRSAVAFDGSKVAIKIVRIVEGKKDVSERRFFEQEARLLYTLENDYLISCYATFVIENDDDTYLHLVMELAEETLEAYIDNLRYNLRFLEENEVWQIFIEILLGLHFLHTNEHRILHRDISLCNILRVLQKGEDGKPDRFIHKLSDLGVARVRREQTESTRSSYYGKVRNFAPEQHQGRSHTEKTDIFQASTTVPEVPLLWIFILELFVSIEGLLRMRNLH